MVTFSCDKCADVFKKPKSTQHIYRCPDAQLTCIDCNTTFRGDDYLKHTSCVSEAEKYQKSLYKPNKKNKQDQTPNKQKQQKFDKSNDLESKEQNKTSNNKKILKNSEQDQTSTTNDDISNYSQDSKDNCSKKKKKHKNKKDQQQDNQFNGNKISVNKEKKGEKDIAVKVNDDKNRVQETVNITKEEDNSNLFDNNSPKKKKKKNKKSTINNINDNKVEGKKSSDNDIVINNSNESMNLNYSQPDENPIKESNVENLNSSSSKKKKKEKNDTNEQNDEAKKIQPHELVADKKNKKSKSAVFLLGHNELDIPIEYKKKKINSRQGELEDPIKIKKQKSNSRQSGSEISTKNKKRETNEEDSRKAKKAKSSHENDITHNLSDYESIPAAVKKIFKSNNHEELNLKRLEEMVAQEFNSNLPANEMKEKFLENIVLVMKDGNIILK